METDSRVIINTPDKKIEVYELSISGMTCVACSARIEKVLNRKEGVEAFVNLASEKARIRVKNGNLIDSCQYGPEKTHDICGDYPIHD